ncbi:MAG: lipocalin-like domain-containing protein [Steroidobacterales bacterium]
MRAIVGLLWAAAVLAVAGAAVAADPSFAAVNPGYTLEFPRDYGSHPQFRIEWWYVTGWLTTAQHETLGFQLTFFRTRPTLQEDNPSAFAPRQLLIAHCAISDPARGRLWQEQRIRRAGFGLAEAQSDNTRIWIDDWRLERRGDDYVAYAVAENFALALRLAVTQPPLLHGAAGYSQKAPAAQLASYYYSEPHVQVSGRVTRTGRGTDVTGEAWLDHEWSSEYLDPLAAGWDWVGLNLDDGGAVMAFRIRDRQGQSYWAGGTLRDARGNVRVFGPQDVSFVPARRWRSPRTDVSYPVSGQVRLGAHHYDLMPLLDDQENDARLSSGEIYWEGAVRAQEDQHPVGRGYLELTGYDRPLSMR